MTFHTSRKHVFEITLHILDTWAPIITSEYNDAVLSPLIQEYWQSATNRVCAYILGFDRTSTPPSIKVYVEFEHPVKSSDLKLQWGDRIFACRKGSASDVNKISKLVGIVENIRPTGPLGPLVSTARRDRAEAFARVPIAIMCRECGKAHASACGNKWCKSDVNGCSLCPGTMPKDMFACLSCSTTFCSKKCSADHFCGMNATNIMLPLLTVVVTKISKTPFVESPPNIREMFPRHQFGVALEEVRTHVHIRPNELEAMASRLCDKVGQYATFVLSEEGTPGLKFAFAARGTYKSVEPLMTTENLSNELDAVYAETQETNNNFKMFMLTNELKELRADLNKTTGPQNGSVPFSQADVTFLFDAVKTHADDDPSNSALCVKITSLFTNRLASLLQHQFSLAPDIPAWGQTARERVGLVFMHVFMRPEHRKYQRLHAASCHLLKMYGRA